MTNTGVTGLSSHQTTVPFVFSDLLSQTVQLQLVDLQVRPNNKNPSSLLLQLESSSCIFLKWRHTLAAVHWYQHKQGLRCVYSL